VLDKKLAQLGLANKKSGANVSKRNGVINVFGEKGGYQLGDRALRQGARIFSSDRLAFGAFSVSKKNEQKFGQIAFEKLE
jgi:hypothetical protein